MNFKSMRGIILKDNKLAVMQRIKDGREYCVFPGGGIEEGESFEECVERELMEEFGIVVKARKMIYAYERNDSIQGFFVLDWISGEIHKTDGEEYQEDRNRGIYNPTMINIEEFEKMNLVPIEVGVQLREDLKVYGVSLDRELLRIVALD